MSERSKQTADQNEVPRGQETPRRVVEARQLLGGENEVGIEHGGVLYRLRLTAALKTEVPRGTTSKIGRI